MAAKYVKTYGVPQETYDSCQDLIQQGNDQSLTAVLILNALLLTGISIYNMMAKTPLVFSFIYAIVAIVIATAFFVLRNVFPKQHYVFYYMTVECTLLFAMYAMTLESYESAVLYPATVILLPLFYMHTSFSMLFFLIANMIAYIVMAVGFPEYCSSFSNYYIDVIPFTVIGIIIHYVYQSNRMRELVSVRDSNYNQKALEIRSNFETLTKLLRRRSFIEISERYIMRGEKEFMAVGILDIDHFKFINDTHGHQVGDQTIEKIGQVLIDTLDISLRAPEVGTMNIDWGADYGNIAGRLGGDEFIFLITSEKDEAGVIQLAERLISTLNNTKVGPLQSIRGSVGISIIDSANHNYDTLYQQADTALYTAKSAGRNRAILYSEELNELKSQKEEEKTDPLTGALKQEPFKEEADTFLREVDPTQYVIAYFDIENFKLYNAQYGFDMGDKFLQEVANSIRANYEDVLLARFGDDHFVAVLPNEDLEHKLGKIKYQLREFRGDYRTAIRIGVYEIREDDHDINIVCDRAKFAGDTIRGRYDVGVQVFDEEQSAIHSKQQYIAGNIDRAIEENWIKVYYQPIVRTYTERVCGLEALARWVDPEKGMLSPGEFIEVLEQTRLIYKLDLYILEEICKGYNKTRDVGLEYVPVSVNLSRVDFEIVDVITEVETLIQEYNMPRNLLHIEITESALSQNDELLKEAVDGFRELGYQVWMDDFGSGYSSLNVLKDYKFDVVKFDMGFLSDTSGRSRVILTSMVDMAKKLNIQTLAEGVETREQYEFLKGIGCEFVQGYLFSKPFYVEDFKEEHKRATSKNVEPIRERGYYDRLGKINVLSRNLTNSHSGNIQEESKSAVAIFEYSHQKVHFLMRTASYENVVRKLGFSSVDEYADMINRDLSENSAKIRKAIEDCVLYDREIVEMIHRNDVQILQYGRCIASDADSGKAALVSTFTEFYDGE